MNQPIHTCAGCMWEDACRAADLCRTECDDYYDPLYEFTDCAFTYYFDLIERDAIYREIVEEQQL